MQPCFNCSACLPVVPHPCSEPHRPVSPHVTKLKTAQLKICSIVSFVRHFLELSIRSPVGSVGFSSSSSTRNSIAASCPWLVQLNCWPVLKQKQATLLGKQKSKDRDYVTRDRLVTLFRSRSLLPLSSFLLSLAGFSGLSA